MMLCYLWIDKFLNLKKQGFNFYGPHRYEFDGKNLHSKPNEQCIQGIYDKSQLNAKINCHLIVGENRSGKTSVFRLLSHLATRDSEFKKRKLLIVFETNNERKVYTNITNISCPISDINDLDDFYDTFLFDNVTYINNSLNIFSGIYGAGAGGFALQCNEFTNLSVDGLLLEKAIGDKNGKFSNTLESDNLLEDFRNDEILREMTFLSRCEYGRSVIENSFKISLPNKISISNSRDYLDVKAALRKKKESKHRIDKWEKEFWGFLGEFQKKIDPQFYDHFDELWAYQSFAHAIFEVLNYSTIEFKDIIFAGIKSALFDRVSQIENSTACKIIQNDFAEFLVDADAIISDAVGASFTNMGKINTPIKSTVAKIVDLTEIGKVKKITRNLWELPLDEFSDLHKQISEIFSVNFWYRLDWRDMSSGERAILSVFSKIYKSIDAKGINTHHNLMMLMLDEPETSLHPQWQRILFSAILKLINKLLENRYIASIQVILSTNQPILLSDFPRRAVTFLEYDQKSGPKCLTDSEVDSRKISAFCADISSLLSRSFLLADGYIGEFALSEVRQIIRKISDHTPLLDKELEIISIIDSPELKAYINNLIQQNDIKSSK